MRPLALTSLAVALMACTPQGIDQARAIRSGWLYVGALEQMPSLPSEPTNPGPGWERVDLPDVWGRARRLRATEGWYAFDVALDAAPAHLQGLLLPRAALNARIYVNGVGVGQGGRFEDPVARNPFNAIYAVVPAELLRAGTNRIAVRLKTTHGGPGELAPLWLGPDAVLRAVTERDRFLSGTLALLAHVISVLVAGVALSRVLRGMEQRPGLGPLAAGLLCFSLGSFSLFVPEIALPSRLVEWITWTLIVLALTLGSVGLRRAAERRARWHDALAVMTPAATAVVLAVVPYADFRVALGFLLVPTALLVADAVLNGVRAMRTGLLAPRLPLAILAFAIVGLPLVELALGPADDLGLRPIGANMAIVALSLAWFLAANILRVAFEAHRLDAELAAEQARTALERDRAVALERDRMVKDMHDGTAGHLVSALSLVRSGDAEPEQLGALLQEALDDLRTTIEALDPAETTLTGMLGVLRSPIERRLRPHGIALDWRIGDIDHVTDLDAADAGNLFRLIQEAVGNAIKHAKATRIEVAAERGEVEGTVVVSVRDDGRGGASERVGGRGLRNMERRARDLGGALAIESDQRGTRVSVTLPALREARVYSGDATDDR